MDRDITYIGLDVHKYTIAVALAADGRGDPALPTPPRRVPREPHQSGGVVTQIRCPRSSTPSAPPNDEVDHYDSARCRL